MFELIRFEKIFYVNNVSLFFQDLTKTKINNSLFAFAHIRKEMINKK